MKKIYEDEISKCNEKWQEIKEQYGQLLSELDILNSSRCNFTLKMQVNVVRFVNRLVSSTTVEESLQEYE